MAEILNLHDLRDIVVGAALLGSGGGGLIEEGFDLINKLENNNKTQIQMITTDEMDDGYATFVAILGNLSVDVEDLDYTHQSIRAFEVMQKVSKNDKKNIKYIMSGELGGSNTAVSLYIAAAKNIPLIDADAQGRAVPELNTSLQYLYNVPMKPLVLAGGNKEKVDEIIVNLDNPLNCEDAEKIARSISVSYGNLIAFSTWPLNAQNIKEYSVPGAMTLCKKIGQIFRISKEMNLDIGKELTTKTDCVELFRGTIVDVQYDSGEGFDSGVTVIKSESNEYKIYFKNENILIKKDNDKTLVTVPELICLADLETYEPVTNAKVDLKTQRNVVCLGMSCPSKWTNTEKGYEVWKPILKEFGYEGDKVNI